MFKKLLYIKMVSLISKQLQRKTIEDDISVVCMILELEEQRYMDAVYNQGMPQDYCDNLDEYVKFLHRRLDELNKRLRDTRRS